MSVRYQLARSATGVRKAKTVNDVIEARFQELEKCFACHAALAQRALEDTPELPFKKPVLVAQLLFFTQRNRIL
jgi:uncharacterized CHY-type Zn-finger protein